MARARRPHVPMFALCLGMALLSARDAAALDAVKVAISNRGGWSTAVTELGQKAGSSRSAA